MSENTSITNNIVAVITRRKDKDKVAGGAPIFVTKSETELDEVSMLLARITLGMVHDLGNGVKVIIKH